LCNKRKNIFNIKRKAINKKERNLKNTKKERKKERKKE
jgi:hypothetical protein